MAYQTHFANETDTFALTHRVSEWVARRVRSIGDFYAERGRLAQLAALDLRTLKDIGYTRAEISSLAHNPKDPTRRH